VRMSDDENKSKGSSSEQQRERERETVCVCVCVCVCVYSAYRIDSDSRTGTRQLLFLPSVLSLSSPLSRIRQPASLQLQRRILPSVVYELPVLRSSCPPYMTQSFFALPSFLSSSPSPAAVFFFLLTYQLSSLRLATVLLSCTFHR
jgi:hypothetical protein